MRGEEGGKREREREEREEKRREERERRKREERPKREREKNPKHERKRRQRRAARRQETDGPEDLEHAQEREGVGRVEESEIEQIFCCPVTFSSLWPLRFFSAALTRAHEERLRSRGGSLILPARWVLTFARK